MTALDEGATQKFIRAVLAEHSKSKKYKLIVVTHLVPGTDLFLEAVQEVFPIAAVIPKPHSIDEQVRDRVKRTMPVICYTRAEIEHRAEELMAKLKALVGDAEVAIIDTGGYFSSILDFLRIAFGERLAAIVEDTENGHQKYDAALAKRPGDAYPCPVLSVARSELKDPEDFLVGQAIVFSADALLRDHGKLLNGKRALVFGYGKIGRSIAQCLHSKGARVDVIDTDPARQVLALAHGFHTDSKSILMQGADLLFCATGNQSIKRSDIKNIKRDSYLFMATSADDEIEDHSLLVQGGLSFGCEAIKRITIKGNQFFLCNNGNPVNFVHGGVVGAYIKLVQAELVFAATQPSTCADLSKIGCLNEEARRFIAQQWMHHFLSA